MTRRTPLGLLFFSAWIGLVAAACGGAPSATDGKDGFGVGGMGGEGGGGDGGTGNVIVEPSGGNGGNGSGCQPVTCEDLDQDCGKAPDGCGDILDCGGCGDDGLCGIEEPGKCTTLTDLCKPVSEEDACAGKECGVAGDGCGETYDCGSCTDGEACGIEEAYQCDVTTTWTDDECPAEILTCASDEAGWAECGIIGNGCGGTLDCNLAENGGGGCADGSHCGLGGPNVCGSVTPTCTPLTPEVACAGTCGVVSNGCGVEVDGGVIDCSTTHPCPDGETCGGGGTPGQCGSGETACTPVDEATACAGKSCGTVSDGCSGSYVCGTCSDGDMCQSGSCQAMCTPVDQATACAGKSCGTIGDGCGSTYDCGTCGADQTCGLNEAFVCGDNPPDVCVPLDDATACAGKECGVVYDGCGTAASNEIDCAVVNGGCDAGEYCGITEAYQCDAPPPPDCTPASSCAELGWSCGTAIDECGNTFDCADEGRTCSSIQACVGGIDGPTECVSGSTNPGCDLCDAVPDCSGQAQLTQITGRVVTPGRNDSNTGNQVGVPNAFVYILQTNDEADLPAFTDGVDDAGESCGRCTDEVLGPVLASALTDSHGEYTIEGNVPVGEEFLLVVKVGKFRRAQHVTLDAGAACNTTTFSSSLPANPTRLPRDMSDGVAVNIPHIAVSTGSADGMECVFEKMGIDHDEFTRPTLGGRIHLYRADNGGGAFPDEQSENCSACQSWNETCQNTYCEGSEYWFEYDYEDTRLYEDGGRLYEYDMVIFDCQGNDWDHEDESDDDNVRDYVNRGGRMFTSHFSRHWICDNGAASYSAGAPYSTGLSSSGTFNCYGDGTYPDTGTGVVSLGRPGANTAKLTAFADWLMNEGAATYSGGEYWFDITDPRALASAVGTYSEEFVYNDDDDSVQQFSFTTPYGAPDDAACGRVAYSAFHVSGGSSDEYFPQHCSGNLTSQEKVLLYTLFDLGGCVGDEPEPPECTPQACTAGTCGTQPDGCGGTQECSCGAGEVCNGGVCEVPGCTKTSCAAEGADCGSISDGCGGVLDCGECPVCTPIDETTACSGLCGFVSDGCGSVYECPLDCGDGVCSSGSCTDTCTPAACPAELECGYVSDGCDGVAFCGDCTLPEQCGAGGEANMCGIPTCDPLTCEDVGAECGMIGDGCGGTVNCGTCEDGKSCGGNGMANQCVGCDPLTCEDVGAECGQIGDGCGNVVNCGPCPAGEFCGTVTANQCGPTDTCEPQSCGDVDAECGVIGDGCGSTVDCGDCPSGEVCGIDTPFKCGPPPDCTPLTCEDVGAQCGMIGDGCGDVVDCGDCTNGGECGAVSPNKCASIK